MVKPRLSDSLVRVFVAVFAALAVFSSAALAQNEPAAEAYNKGVQAQQAKNLDSAAIYYQQAIAADANYYDAYLNLGAIQYQQGNYDDALKTFKTAAEKKPDNVDAYANVARVEFVAKRYPEAEEAYKKALVNGQDRTDLQKELAKVYFLRSNFPLVIETVEKVHAANAADDESWYMLGKAQEKQEMTKEAIAAYEQSIAAREQNYQAHFALGNIYLQQQNYAKAAEQFKAALEDDPKAFRAAYNYAVSMESANGDNVDANIANWEEFIRIGKNHPKAKQDVAIAQQHVAELKALKASKASAE